MTGRMIGHYELLQHLGTGGVGEVYAGLDHFLGRKVAIKALRPDLAGDAVFASRFLAEASNLARLNHPNITILYALHREGAEFFRRRIMRMTSKPLIVAYAVFIDWKPLVGRISRLSAP